MNENLLLESKNDESRFGLTRAPFSEQRDAGVRPKPSLAVTLLRAEIAGRASSLMMTERFIGAKIDCRIHI
ncbi:MAG TPA: hypothetical protein VLR90_12860 [Blastocatellia bacterium]|nr:hypothetical protein [Blastocatellia bacterium]